MKHHNYPFSNLRQSPIIFNHKGEEFLGLSSNSENSQIAAMRKQTVTSRKYEEKEVEVEEVREEGRNEGEDSGRRRIEDGVRVGEDVEKGYRKMYKSTDGRLCQTSKTKRRRKFRYSPQTTIIQNLHPILQQTEQTLNHLITLSSIRIPSSIPKQPHLTHLTNLLQSYLNPQSPKHIQKPNPLLLAYAHYNLGVAYIKINEVLEVRENSEDRILFHFQTTVRLLEAKGILGELGLRERNGDGLEGRLDVINRVCCQVMLYEAEMISSQESTHNNRTDPINLIYRAYWYSIFSIQTASIQILTNHLHKKSQQNYLNSLNPNPNPNPNPSLNHNHNHKKHQKILNTLYILLSDLDVTNQFMLTLDFGERWEAEKYGLRRKLGSIRAIVEERWEEVLREYEVDVKGGEGLEGQDDEVDVDQQLFKPTFLQLSQILTSTNSKNPSSTLHQSIALTTKTILQLSTYLSSTSNSELAQDILRRCYHLCQQYLNKSSLFYKVKSKYESYKWGGTCIRETTKQQESQLEESGVGGKSREDQKEKGKGNVGDKVGGKDLWGVKRKRIGEMDSVRHRIRFMRSLEVRSSRSQRKSSQKGQKNNLSTVQQLKTSMREIDPVTRTIMRVYDQFTPNSQDKKKTPTKSPKKPQLSTLKHRYNFHNAIQEFSSGNMSQTITHPYQISPQKIQQSFSKNGTAHVNSKNVDLCSGTRMMYNYKMQRINRVKDMGKM